MACLTYYCTQCGHNLPHNKIIKGYSSMQCPCCKKMNTIVEDFDEEFDHEDNGGE